MTEARNSRQIDPAFVSADGFYLVQFGHEVVCVWDDEANVVRAAYELADVFVLDSLFLSKELDLVCPSLPFY